MSLDFVKDAGTRAALEVQDADWGNNPFRHFRGVVLERKFEYAASEITLPVNISFKPELVIPLLVVPDANSLTVHYDKFSIGNIVVSVSAPCRIVVLVGRFDSQVTGKGVKTYGG